MKKGQIISNWVSWDTQTIQGEFHIDFSNGIFGPYTYLFDRKRLYFSDETWERWSYFFPLKSTVFDNTEIFLETNDIVITLWERWTFSGKTKTFVEIVNLKTHKKYRFYPDEVSLIYNTKYELVIYYRKSQKYKKLTLSQASLEKESEKTCHLDAFFKLFYNHDTQQYGRLYYIANSKSHQAWYFEEEIIHNNSRQDIGSPLIFTRETFKLLSKNSERIDIWQASLTWRIFQW